MERSADLTAEEVTRIQRCINDLISVLAFPAMWTGRTPFQMVGSFLDGLLRMLRLDVAYVRLTQGSDAPLDCLRMPADLQPEVPAAGAWFAAQGPDPNQWGREMRWAAGRAAIPIATQLLGLPPGRGIVAVGACRAGFPFQTERLLLNVAANQLLLGLQEPQLRAQHEEALRKAQSALANVSRVSTLGVLTASIAHEVNQPLAGIMTNAGACLMMLTAQPANIEGALETARRTLRDGRRAADVIERLRTLYTKKNLRSEPIDLNEAAREVVALSVSELQRNRVVLRLELADNLPPVHGDRVQLQQVILNLLGNAADAMRTVEERPHELLIRTAADEPAGVRFSLSDSGVGFGLRDPERIFEPFYTTKSDGMGIGLSVSRSIIEAHSGRLWATPNKGPGVTFTFSLPSHATWQP